MRYLLGFLCVCALGAMPLVGCSETTGGGGNGGAGGDGGNGGDAGSGGRGGDGGTGGTVTAGCDRGLCEGVDCNDNDFCTDDFCSGADGTCSYVARCDDLNDCTTETCDSGNESCSTPAPVADGTSCAGGTCQSGVCVLSGTVLPCTEQGIRNAIAAGDGTYTFDCDGTTPVVVQRRIEIDSDVTLDGGGKLAVDGSCITLLFQVLEDVTAELRGIAVTNGFGTGIFNWGTLIVRDSTVSQCTGAPNPLIPGAGGIVNFGTATLLNSTVSGNSHQSFGGGVGGILAGVSLAVTNSTVSGNTGLAIWGDATLTNSTVSGDIVGNLTMAGSLIHGECVGEQTNATSLGYNIESPGNTCGFDQTGDQSGVTAEELNLGPLQDNSGPTMTHALLTEPTVSRAIDRIPADDCEVDIDQRGEPRPETGGTMCDVGAFELEAGPCGGFTTGACEDPSLSCQCCPIGGPAQSCLCSTPCNSDAECTDPSRTTCNRPDFVGSTGFCAPAEFTCCWLCV